MNDVERTIEESTDDQLERLRGALAIEVRADPALLSNLEAVEAAIGRRQLDQRRDEAASQEAARAAEEAAEAEQAADRRRKEAAVKAAQRELALASSELEDLLGQMLTSISRVVKAVDARSDAGLQLGRPPDDATGRAVVGARLRGLLSAAVPGEFDAPPHPRFSTERLDVLLGTT